MEAWHSLATHGLGSLNGRNKQEDVVGMLSTNSNYNDYWQDKRAKVENINVPAYVLASYSTFLHTFGSFRGYQGLSNENKWLRVHATQEWHDLYKKSTNDELQAFLDRYTKDIENGWEETPKVRVSVIRFDQPPITDLLLPSWPPPAAKDRTFYLSSNSALEDQLASSTGVATYQADLPALQMDADPGELRFSYTFDKQSTILGTSRATLYMSTHDADDMDVFVQLRKADKDGNLLQYNNIPAEDWHAAGETDTELVNPLVYLGPTGCLRASYRTLNDDLSNTIWAEHDFQKTEKLQPQEIVKLEIGLWQTGMRFEPGEQMILKIAGHNMTLAEFPPLRGALPNANNGMHMVHFGGQSPSQIVIPFM
ncbi:hypothetical protein LTR95_007572 [Oleoguttula sp. CCFEE 5521]